MSGPWTSAGSKKYKVRTVSKNGEKGFKAFCYDDHYYVGPGHYAGRNSTRESIAKARNDAKADLAAHRKEKH